MVLSRWVVLKLYQAFESPGVLVKSRLPGAGLEISDSLGLGSSPRISISDKSPGDADTAGLRVILCEPQIPDILRLYGIGWVCFITSIIVCEVYLWYLLSWLLIVLYFCFCQAQWLFLLTGQRNEEMGENDTLKSLFISYTNGGEWIRRLYISPFVSICVSSPVPELNYSLPLCQLKDDFRRLVPCDFFFFKD